MNRFVQSSTASPARGSSRHQNFQSYFHEDDELSFNSHAPKHEAIEHVRSVPLHPQAKVGFSILNLTGYPIRYLQAWEDGQRTTCEYLQHGERGLLNFIASNTLIRDNVIVEESFSSQTIHTYVSSSSGPVFKDSLGHQVSLQIAGYKWLWKVQADMLGIGFEDIQAVIGMLNLSKIYLKWQVQNALKLVTEVIPHNGGRMLQLSSTFVIKNMTNHPIRLLSREVKNISKVSDDVPFILEPNDSFNVPLALLYRSVLRSNASALGFIWMAPHSMSAIVDELGVSSHMISCATYSSDPVDLMRIVSNTTETKAGSGENNRDVKDCHMQLACQLEGIRGRRKKSNKMTWDASSSYAHEMGDFLTSSTRIIDFDNLPKFCYSIEMESISGSRSGLADMAQHQNLHTAEGAPELSQCIYSIGMKSF